MRPEDRLKQDPEAFKVWHDKYKDTEIYHVAYHAIRKNESGVLEVWDKITGETVELVPFVDFPGQE